MKRQLLLASTVLTLLLVASCNRVRKYPLQGEVVAKNPTTGEVTIRHGDIPGFMEAMTMPYRLKDAAVARALRPGDTITAQLVLGRDPGDFWLDDVHVTGNSGRTNAQSSSQMLMAGDHAPDISLVNQDGRTLRLSDYAGKAVLVTFIYTRCPLPDFCPRLSSQFAQVEKDLQRTPEDYAKTHLLTISFDPNNDTPPVLRKYGLTYLDGKESGFSHWDFVTTTAADLERLATAFGLQYEKQDNEIIQHNMRVVLIAPDGTIAKYWSADWTWQDLAHAMRGVLRQ